MLQVRPKGALAEMPRLLVPLKYCTCVTVPSLSKALALIVIFAGAAKRALLAGLVMLTLNGLLVVTTAKDGLLVLFSLELMLMSRL